MEQPPANEDVPPPAPAQAADSGSSGAAVSLDSEWSDADESPVALITDDDDYEMHESCEEVEESDEDLSAFLVDGSVAEQASRLVRDDLCEQKCLKGKEAELGKFLQSVSGMERSERITSVMAALAVPMQADTASLHPQIRRGEFAAKPHGNKKNKNASVIDARWLIERFTEFAKEVGDVVPVRVRMKVSRMFERYLLPLTPPQPNAETIDQMHRKVRPFVPLEFQDDPLYAAPTADEAAQSKNTKRARLKHRADMALEVKRVQDEQQNSPSFVEQLEQAMNDIEDASALPKAKQPKRSTTKKKARKGIVHVMCSQTK
ncbi:unnamed protein product [Phytophthora fragariaefolia]|uniref:Unnamed protein product n=1 Tax=Phytophthora fragariaefolia TaxID=1490495 RepID=A0A9W6XAS8_9STRA|nr:unnamed protein product [Phytophthora fragariaefolia]